MLETFLTATASSTLLISAFHGAYKVKLAPRCYSGLSFFAHFDGNILGGALLGAGMAPQRQLPWDGSHPGQWGYLEKWPSRASWRRALLVSLDRLPPPLAVCTLEALAAKCKEPFKALHEALGISRYVTTAAFEGLLAAAIAGPTYMSTVSRRTPNEQTGCTSGYGITGMSLLSVSSFVTIGSALAVGVLTARTIV